MERLYGPDRSSKSGGSTGVIVKKCWEYLTKQPKGPDEARFLSSLQQNFLRFFNISNKKVNKEKPATITGMHTGNILGLVFHWQRLNNRNVFKVKTYQA